MSADPQVLLAVAGAGISPQRDTFYTSERSYGSFTRSFTLPEGVDADKIKAELKEGVLTLMVPKKAEADRRHEQVIRARFRRGG